MKTRLIPPAVVVWCAAVLIGPPVRAGEPRAITTAASSGSAHNGSAEVLDVAPRDGVLVLRNGETLSGRITRVGDQFDLTLPTSQWRIKASDVEFVCGSLPEAYQRKAAAIPARSAADHVALAEWCLKQKLFEAAEHELRRAEAIEPAFPRATVVRRRLVIALAPPPPVAPAAPPATTPPPKPRGGLAPVVTSEEIERRLAELPTDVVETFAQQVQPALIASCGQSGCHGQRATSDFRVARLPPARTSARRVTLRNLYSALESVDRTDPPRSPLLKNALAAHGDAKEPPIANRERPEFQNIAAWAASLAASSPEKNAAAVPTPNSDKPAPNPPREPKNVSTSLLDARPPDTVAHAGRDGEPARLPRTNPTAPPTPVGGDPFDPEVFNRRYLNEAGSPRR